MKSSVVECYEGGDQETMLGKCVGTGSSCEVYEWGGNDKVVKLFHANTPSEAVQLEFRNSSSAWKSGLPIARPFEQVIWDGRLGIIFEKIVGETIVNRLLEQLYSFRKANFNDANSELRIFARVLKALESGFKSVRESANRLIKSSRCL